MTICHYTNSLSAHQLPLDYELVKLVGAENFRYIYTEEYLQGGAQEVWIDEPWIIKDDNSTVDLHLQPTPIADWLENCDLLIVGGIRPVDLMERRLAAGKATFYMAERWFKPFLINVTIPFFNIHSELQLPGWLRLLHPRYFKMAKRFVKLFKNPRYRFLPIGPWSAYDMRLLCRVMHPFTSHFSLLTSHFVPWGDFVEETKVSHVERREHGEEIKILWVGRMLRLKHVETIIRAVAHANKRLNSTAVDLDLLSRPHFTLTLVGDGPEKPYLEKLASTLQLQLPTPTNSPCSPRSQWLRFLPPVSLTEVRGIMRDHDLYIFSSNGFDGWGAVVPEAMTEGMTALGTYEAGASAALLPESNLFHCGDWKTLSKLLLNFATPDSQPSTPNPQHTPLPYDYTPKGAAERLLKEFDSIHSSTSTSNFD